MKALTHKDINEAQAIVEPHMSPTPQLQWPLLCEKFGTEIWVKHENHTPTGAFKVRGGLVYLDRLSKRANPPSKLITATRGN
ncbi:MAG: pyridoxal-phosphate dependent enzyme, partial [Verrucomicrobiota bacterium]